MRGADKFLSGNCAPLCFYRHKPSDSGQFCQIPNAPSLSVVRARGGPPRSVNNGPSAWEQISTDRIWLAVPKPTERQRNGKSDQSRNDAEHFVGELGPTFPVVRSTSESTPQTERPCAEKLAF